MSAPVLMLAACVVRADSNLNEALLPFAILVFAATTTRAGNHLMAYASVAFFFARLAHAGLYLAGATPWRSISYYIGLLATLVFASQMVA
jgi:uncharacterized MAPEG superfamily protein